MNSFQYNCNQKKQKNNLCLVLLDFSKRRKVYEMEVARKKEKLYFVDTHGRTH